MCKKEQLLLVTRPRTEGSKDEKLTPNFTLWINICHLCLMMPGSYKRRNTSSSKSEFSQRYLKITEKSLIQHCERSELRLQKSIKNAKNNLFWRVLYKPEDCGKTVLPDRSLYIGQKFVENAKIEKAQMRHFR